VKGSLGLAWALFFLYAVWAAALQGLLASPRQLGEWTPDLGLVLLFAWAARLPGGRGGPAALLVALARATFGGDPPAAVAAGSLGAFGLFAGLRTMLEVDRAVPRAILCGLCAWLSAHLLIGARLLALAAEAPAADLAAGLAVRLWPGALFTALLCLVLAPLCRRLPGLAALARRRP
jgi:hypothetical protein